MYVSAQSMLVSNKNHYRRNIRRFDFPIMSRKGSDDQ